MGKQFRVRVRTKQAPSHIHKGSSSSSCPIYSKNREIAKAARSALRQRLIAVDDIAETLKTSKKCRQIEKALTEPLEEITLQKSNKLKTKNPNKAASVHFVDGDVSKSDDETETTKPCPNVTVTPVELENEFNLIGKSLVVAVDRRSKQRIELLSKLRSILKKIEALGSLEEHVSIATKYSQHFLPILFQLYTDVNIETDGSIESEPNVKLPAFETVRVYLPFVTSELADFHASLALKKLENEEINDKKKLLITNILIALCQRVSFVTANSIFTWLQPWFTMDAKYQSLQKKAYRIMTELYKRRDDLKLSIFFEMVEPSVSDILRLEIEAIAEPAWAARLAMFRLVLDSLKSLKDCETFYTIVFHQVIAGMDRSHNSLARKNAVKCFQALIDKMIKMSGESEEIDNLRLQILDSIEARIFNYADFQTSSINSPLERVRPTLIAMNIFAQQHLKTMNGALVSRFLNHATVFLKDNRPVIRVLVIRLIRIFCKKLPQFMLTQFQDIILFSIFQNQPSDENTSTIRKANRFLFETLIDKFGYERVCKYAVEQEGLLKFLKKLEKLRRRKLNVGVKKGSRLTVNDEDEEDDDGVSAMSALTQSKTIKADSIFNLLQSDDDDTENEDDEDAKSRVAQSALSIKAYRKFVLDSDRNATAIKQEVKSEKLPKGLRIAVDGRLIIEDDVDDDMQGQEDVDDDMQGQEDDESEDDYNGC